MEASSLRTPDRGPSLRGYCWDNNNVGGLGIASVARAMVPVAVALPEGTVDVQGGSDFTVALTSSGQVWGWGGNGYGQLGDGSDTLRLTPHQVQLPSGVRAASISVGAGHVLVLSESGSVFGWGHNTHGQVGDGTTTDRREPVEVSVGQVTRLATGIASSHAVTSTGSLLSWGRAISRTAVAAAMGGPVGRWCSVAVDRDGSCSPDSSRATLGCRLPVIRASSA
jgi:alpha-tubulin suppressor-like RCC1 family protein